jgi:hypothetical protein
MCTYSNVIEPAGPVQAGAGRCVREWQGQGQKMSNWVHSHSSTCVMNTSTYSRKTRDLLLQQEEEEEEEEEGERTEPAGKEFPSNLQHPEQNLTSHSAGRQRELIKPGRWMDGKAVSVAVPRIRSTGQTRTRVRQSMRERIKRKRDPTSYRQGTQYSTVQYSTISDECRRCDDINNLS